jgi:urea transporter
MWQPPTRDPSVAARRGIPRPVRLTILGVCTGIVLAAFVATVVSLSTQDIDGLNYLPNVLFALPWNLAAAPAIWALHIESNVYAEAVVDCAGALVNVALLGWLMRRVSSPR